MFSILMLFIVLLQSLLRHCQLTVVCVHMYVYMGLLPVYVPSYMCG